MAFSPVAEFVNVSKTYRTGWLGQTPLSAVRDVSLRIDAGEVFGLLGPNRAGKTTLIKILLSLCPPTHGKVVRLGMPADLRPTLLGVGYVHESHTFPGHLTPCSLLEYYGTLSCLPPKFLREKIPAVLRRVGLPTDERLSFAQFSKGMKQRMALAQAILNEPDLLILDEPSEGLDLEGRALIRDVLAEQRQRGGGAIVVSHILTEVEAVCDRVGVMVEGRLTFVGKVTDLTRTSDGNFRPIEQVVRELYARR